MHLQILFPHLHVLHTHFPAHIKHEHIPNIYPITLKNIKHKSTIMITVAGCDNCILNPIIKYINAILSITLSHN